MPGYLRFCDLTFIINAEFKHHSVFHVLLSVEVCVAFAAFDVSAYLNHVPGDIGVIVTTIRTPNQGNIKPSLSFAQRANLN